MSLTSAASFPNGHLTRSPVSPDTTRQGHRQGLRHLPETILEGRHHSRRQRHALACRIRAPKTHRWHHCPSCSRLLHQVPEAAADEVTVSPRVAVPQASAPRAHQADHQVPVRIPLGHEVRDRRESGRSPLHEETRGSGPHLAHHVAALAEEDETESKEKQLRTLAQISPKSSA